SSARCPRATRPWSGNAGRRSPAANGSGSPSPAPCSATSRSSSSTRPPPDSTLTTPRWCATPWTDSPRGAPRSSSPTSSPTSWTATRWSCSPAVASSNRAARRGSPLPRVLAWRSLATSPRRCAVREEDRTLAAADPGVPGIATVLDEACLAERLADAGWDVDGARLTYLRYKPGTSLVGGLILRRSDGARIRAFAAAYGEGAPEKLDKSWRAAARHSGVILTDRDAGLVVGDVAADRDLPGVRSVLTRYPAAQAVAYKPARRWVGIDTGRGRVLKVHRPRAAAAHVAAHRLLAPHLPTAELLATGKDGVVATRFVPGTALETVDRTSAQQYRRSVGAVLAAAHRAPVPPGLEPMDLHRTLSGAVGAVEAVAP